MRPARPAGGPAKPDPRRSLGEQRFRGLAVARPPADFRLAVAGDTQRALARGWLVLGLIALIGSGLFSLLLVAARTPGVNTWLPGGDFFRIALVLHVDLSVLVWFSAIASMLWCLNTSTRAAAWSWAALGLCAAGTLLMVVAAFASPGTPIMANYIPVLTSPLFHAGLVMFGVGAALQVLRSLWAAERVGGVLGGAGALRFGLNASVVAAAVALIALVWSLAQVPTALDGKDGKLCAGLLPSTDPSPVAAGCLPESGVPGPVNSRISGGSAGAVSVSLRPAIRAATSFSAGQNTSASVPTSSNPPATTAGRFISDPNGKPARSPADRKGVGVRWV